MNHFKKVHGRLPPGYENQQKFMCDQCTNVFFNEWSLKLHIKGQEISAGNFGVFNFTKSQRICFPNFCSKGQLISKANFLVLI